MKNLLLFIMMGIILSSCSSLKKPVNQSLVDYEKYAEKREYPAWLKENDPKRIAKEKIKYAKDNLKRKKEKEKSKKKIQKYNERAKRYQ